MGYHRVGFWTLALLVAFACKASAWGDCSRGCGGGRQGHRTCLEFMWVKYKCHTNHRSCNNFCYHDGYFSGGCHCHSGASGYCCEHCHAIAHCNSGHQQCAQHGARCSSCLPGYYSPGGWNNGCRDIRECASNPCKHGGHCSEPRINMYRCTCRPGFLGRNCEIVTPDFCYKIPNTWGQWSPCSTTCGGGLRQRNCTLRGQHGDWDEEECSKTCLNQGDYYGGRCNCLQGTTGACCTDIIDCASQPCKNGGNCTEGINVYSCTCPAGTQQPHCDDILECASHPCQNGGTCHEFVNHYTCDCLPGTTGHNCIDIPDCASTPCLNNGTCLEHVGLGTNGYTCQCPAGTTDINCQDIPDCISHPCQNGGTCNEMVNGYTCTCTTHATGAFCEKDLFSRHDYVCHNGSCYMVFQRKDTWQGAKEFCEARFGHLVVPEYSQEEAYIENYMNSMRVRYSDTIFWIGAKKSGTASPLWVDGIRSRVYHWPGGVSDDVAGNQCLAMDGGYSFQWQAYPCDRKSHFICEERVPYTGVVG